MEIGKSSVLTGAIRLLFTFIVGAICHSKSLSDNGTASSKLNKPDDPAEESFVMTDNINRKRVGHKLYFPAAA